MMVKWAFPNFFVLFILFASQVVLASPLENEPIFVSQEVSVEDGAGLNKIIDETIDALEESETESKGLIRDYLSALNLKKVVRRAKNVIREAYHDPAKRETVYDLATTWVFSHGTEVASGWIWVGATTAMDAPAWVISTGGAIGAVIALPTFIFDPLCIILFGSYRRYPGFRVKVRTARLALFRYGGEGLRWIQTQTQSARTKCSSLLGRFY